MGCLRRLGCLAVIVVIFGAGFYLARLITSPVTALVEATERIRRNDLDFELPVRTQDETGVLTEAFRDAADGSATAFGESRKTRRSARFSHRPASGNIFAQLSRADSDQMVG